MKFMPGDLVAMAEPFDNRHLWHNSLVQPHPTDALEHEAFTGRSNFKRVGLMGCHDVAIVLATREDYLYLLCKNVCGWSCVSGMYKVTPANKS